MIHRTELLVVPSYHYPGVSPEVLIEAQQEVPVTPDNYIPVAIFGQQSDLQIDLQLKRMLPTITRLGEDAVTFSLEQPFGFMGWVGEPEEEVIERTQKTDSLALKPAPGPNHWAVTVSTAEPLTPVDTNLFPRGVRLYLIFALPKILPRRSAI